MLSIDAQDGDEVVILEDEADLLAAEDRTLLLAHLSQFAAIDGYRPAVWPVERAKHVEQRRLAAAGGADNGGEFPLLNFQRNAIERFGEGGLCAVVLFKVYS